MQLESFIVLYYSLTLINTIFKKLGKKFFRL